MGAARAPVPIFVKKIYINDCVLLIKFASSEPKYQKVFAHEIKSQNCLNIDSIIKLAESHFVELKG